jgi:hypothetical protein
LGFDAKRRLEKQAQRSKPKITKYLSDPKISDRQKLLYITSLALDVDAFFKPVQEIGENIKDDQESKELFKLYVQDRLSSAKWRLDACEALNGPASAASVQSGNGSAASIV